MLIVRYETAQQTETAITISECKSRYNFFSRRVNQKIITLSNEMQTVTPSFCNLRTQHIRVLCIQQSLLLQLPSIHIIHIKIQQDATAYHNLFHIYIKSNMFRATHHHQEPKTALAASGFACVEGCWSCSCWTMMGGVSPETC